MVSSLALVIPEKLDANSDKAVTVVRELVPLDSNVVSMVRGKPVKVKYSP